MVGTGTGRGKNTHGLPVSYTKLLTKFSITLLKDLVSLFDEDTRAANLNAKHANSASNASQPESVALSLNSSMGGSVDVEY